MRLPTRRTALAAGLLAAPLLALALAAAPAPAATQQVNIYSSRHYDTDQQLYDGFTKATGIEVNRIEGDADQLIERIKAEGRNSPADLLITVDAGRLWRAEQAGVLQPIHSKVLDERIPASLRHPDGLWFGVSKRVRIIIYAKDRVQPDAIKTYEELADPKWHGAICMRSSTNVYNQSLVASMIAADGLEATEQWAKGLVANFARAPQGADTDQIKAVAAGECDISVVNHYYLVRLIESDDPDDRAVAAKIGIVFPNQAGRGAEANISGVGVTVNAPDKANAIKFLEYLTTDQAQIYFTEGNYEFPAVPGVPLEPALARLGDFKTDPVNASEYGQNNAAAVKLMDRVGWQ